MRLEGSLQGFDIALLPFQFAQRLPQELPGLGRLGADEVQDLVLDLDFEESHKRSAG